ncbi:hypothetical protein D3C72_1830380 [compost metagenome]
MVRALPAQLAHQHDLVAIVAAEAAVFLRHGQAQQAGVAGVVPQLARYAGVGDPLLELLGRRVFVDPFSDAVGEEDDVFVLHEVGFGRVEHVHVGSSLSSRP